VKEQMIVALPLLGWLLLSGWLQMLDWAPVALPLLGWNPALVSCQKSALV
jgi:hypothetical protein